jgi:hypothetical protein
MILELATLSDANAERVVRSPALALSLIFPDDDEIELGEDIEPLRLEPGEGAVTDLEKAWDGIHYLLTGTSGGGDPPLNSLLCGGQALQDDGEWGYGPPAILSRAQTLAFHEALSSLSNRELAARFDPADMMAKKIYPEVWDRDPADDDTLDYLMVYIRELRECLGRAAEGGFGLLVAVT